MSKYQYDKPARILAPSITRKMDRYGNFIEYIDREGRRYDRNGNQKY